MEKSAFTPRWIHGFSVVVAVLTFFLVFAGGLVTSKGAGLAVPDWPLSYGTLMPEGWFRAENVRAEHSHRMIAGVVGILTVILAVILWRTESRRWLCRFAWVAVAMVIIQAILGGLVVRLLGPLEAKLSHALTGQTFFCLMVCLTLFTSKGWQGVAAKFPSPSTHSLRALSVLLVTCVFIQLLLGAFMRHTQSGLAIPTFPLSYGQWIPGLDAATIHNINVDRFSEGLPDLTKGQILVHFLHRAWAVVVCFAAALSGVNILRRFKDIGGLLFPFLILFMLLALQVGLGIMIIFSEKQPHIATAHVAIGALILALSLVLCLQSFHLVGQSHSAAAPSRSPAPSSSREAAI